MTNPERYLRFHPWIDVIEGLGVVIAGTLRDVMHSRRQDPADLEISDSLDSAALPMPDGSWMEISRDRIGSEDGTAMEMATAVYGVYLYGGASR